MNKFHLLTSAALLVLVSGVALAQRVATEKPKVVFVCEHGAAKSVLAAAEFERIDSPKTAISLEVQGNRPTPAN